MAEGKPYRYGLMVAGMGVVAFGLFIMTQERPHIYATMCALGAAMLCVGTVWSLCQCYPKVIVAPEIQKESLEDLVCAAAEAENRRCTKALPGSCGQKPSIILSEVQKNHSHSCPTLHLV